MTSIKDINRIGGVYIFLIVFFAANISHNLNAKADDNFSGNKKVSVVIVGHGSIPKDFPKTKEYFQLHNKGGEELEKIENELINWPRNEQNDVYYTGFMRIVDEIKKSGKFHSTHAAFNEMCAPKVEDALKEALDQNPDKIIVTSIMVTPGGGHSEKDIPEAVEKFQNEHPDVEIIYAWPYNVKDISDLLIGQLNKFSSSN